MLEREGGREVREKGAIAPTQHFSILNMTMKTPTAAATKDIDIIDNYFNE